MLKNLLRAAAVGGLLMATQTAHAAVTVVVGPAPGQSSAVYTPGGSNNTATFNFNGFSGNNAPVIPGLTSTLALKLLGVTYGATSTFYSFEYVLTNTSSNGVTSRASVFGFNSNPDLKKAFYVSGPFDKIGSGNLSNGNNPLEFCIKNSTGNGNGGANNCAGGNNGGPTNGNSFTGSFDLEYAGVVNSIDLTDFGVRYQSIEGVTGVESGIGRPIMSGIVPEPATWAMMILGFGLIGGALRSRKAQAVRVTYA